MSLIAGSLSISKQFIDNQLDTDVFIFIFICVSRGRTKSR